jgi:hypothetical protein
LEKGAGLEEKDKNTNKNELHLQSQTCTNGPVGDDGAEGGAVRRVEGGGIVAEAAHHLQSIL